MQLVKQKLIISPTTIKYGMQVRYEINK